MNRRVDRQALNFHLFSAARILRIVAAAITIYSSTLNCSHALADDSRDTRAASKQIPAFALEDTRGKRHTRDDWKNAKAVVLFFIDTECPVSNSYAPDMRQIAEKFSDRGVFVLGVHCDESVTAAGASEHAKQYRLDFPLLLDQEMILARATGARVTPEAVVTSADGRVMYRGRIDDRYATDGKRRDEPRVLFLDDAIRAVLAGRDPSVRETQAFGCPLPPLPESGPVKDRAVN